MGKDFVRRVRCVLTYALTGSLPIQGGKIKSLPLSKNDLVLGVGSGSNPIMRADILVDRYVMTTEEHRSKGTTVKIDDRPFIVGDAEDLPFVDDAFDFVIARHVLEHLNRPYKFVSELKRVSKGGYIETPSPFTELIHGGYQSIDQTIPRGIMAKLHHGPGTKGHKWFIVADKSGIFIAAKSKELYASYLFLGFFVKHNTRYQQKRFFKANPG